MIGNDAPLKRYELVERIAVGGMAEVFLAKSYGLHDFEKVLAIKRILPNLASDPKFERRFVAEAKIAVTLTHANIVQILDFSRFGESLYIAMEFVDGADLATVLKCAQERDESVPLGVGLHIGIEFLSGLDFAHSRSVVHRDVSPSNVLLSRAGEVKVADFGIAQAADLDHTQTRSFKIVGKWRYMSPEQTRGEPLDARSDIFSAGSVIFELLTGHKLFPGIEPEDIVRQIRGGDLPRATEVRPELPVEIDALLARALHRDPDARCTAAELRDELVSFSYAQAVPATPMLLARYLDALDLRAFGVDRQTPSSGPRGLLEEILREELSSEHRSRITPQAVGPPAFRPEDAEIGRDDITQTSLSLIRSMPGPDGLTQWVLEDATDLHEIGTDTDAYALGDAADTVVAPAPGDDDTAATRLLPVGRPAAGPAGPARLGPARIAAPLPTRVVPAAAPVHIGADAEPAGAPTARRPLRRGSLAVLGLLALAGAVAAAAVAFGGGQRGSSDAAGVATLIDAAAPALQTVVFESRPAGAAVIFAGEAIGHTPMRRDMRPGRYAVTLELEGHRPCAREAQVEHVGQARVFCELEAAEGTLSVESAPEGADVSVGGRTIGSTPLVRAMPVGDLEVELRLEGYLPATASARVEAGEVATISKILRPVERPGAPPSTGTVDIFSDPWADIYLGGKKVGVAPMQNLRLPRGRHRLRLVNPVQGRETTLTVSVPGKRPYRIELPPAAAP